MAYKEIEKELSSLLSNMALQAQRERINTRLRKVEQEERDRNAELNFKVNEIAALKRSINSKKENLFDAAQRNVDSQVAFGALNSKYKTSGGNELSSQLSTLSLSSLNEEINRLQDQNNQLDNDRENLIRGISYIGRVKNTLEDNLMDVDKDYKITSKDIDALFVEDEGPVSKLKTEIEEQGFADTEELFKGVAAQLKEEDKLESLNKAFFGQMYDSVSKIDEGIAKVQLDRDDLYSQAYSLAFYEDSKDKNIYITESLEASLEEYYGMLKEQGTDVEEQFGISEEDFQLAFKENVGPATNYDEYKFYMSNWKKNNEDVAEAWEFIFEKMNVGSFGKFKQIDTLNQGLINLDNLKSEKINSFAVRDNLSNNTSSAITTVDFEDLFPDIEE